MIFFGRSESGSNFAATAAGFEPVQSDRPLRLKYCMLFVTNHSESPPSVAHNIPAPRKV